MKMEIEVPDGLDLSDDQIKRLTEKLASEAVNTLRAQTVEAATTRDKVRVKTVAESVHKD